MRPSLSHLLLAGLSLVPIACDRGVKLGVYTITAPPTFSPSDNVANSLRYNGRVIWDRVLICSPQTAHDDIFVFMSRLQDAKGMYTSEPQLFAVRGAGPVIVLSQRIIGREFNYDGHFVNDAGNYELENVQATPDGVSADYLTGLQPNGSDKTESHDLAWPQIKSLLDESAALPTQLFGEGNYPVRILPPNSSALHE